jgi:hypothetical protein
MNVLQTIRAVAWSFIGIRKGRGLQDDLSKLNPFAVIATALLGVALFIALLVLVVNWVVAK